MFLVNWLSVILTGSEFTDITTLGQKLFILFLIACFMVLVSAIIAAVIYFATGSGKPGQVKLPPRVYYPTNPERIVRHENIYQEKSIKGDRKVKLCSVCGGDVSQDFECCHRCGTRLLR